MTLPAHDAATLSRELRALADPARAAGAQRYFKTGPGEYGEGDRFLGVTVPQIRRLARAHRSAKLPALRKLLRSKWHEERTLALIILANAYPKASATERNAIFDFYLSHTAHINNWDLVDCSADRIVGAHLDAGDWRLLTRLARSRSVWERRIAVIASRRWIREGNFAPTLELARMLLSDSHDLIHKATGWMLRDVADRDRRAAEAFLAEHLDRMPRTMLRYAIEKFPEALRKRYLKS
jgi:3-methyladenine DNA glycosylase AlkD